MRAPHARKQLGGVKQAAFGSMQAELCKRLHRTCQGLQPVDGSYLGKKASLIMPAISSGGESLATPRSWALQSAPADPPTPKVLNGVFPARGGRPAHSKDR